VAKKKAVVAGHRIVKRDDGRWAVMKRGGGTINGAEKAKILVEAGKIAKPKVKVLAPVEAAPAE
jgi:hypothetical protein